MRLDKSLFYKSGFDINSKTKLGAKNAKLKNMNLGVDF